MNPLYGYSPTLGKAVDLLFASPLALPLAALGLLVLVATAIAIWEQRNGKRLGDILN